MVRFRPCSFGEPPLIALDPVTGAVMTFLVGAGMMLNGLGLAGVAVMLWGHWGQNDGEN